jgi:FkbM family methyltransferase
MVEGEWLRSMERRYEIVRNLGVPSAAFYALQKIRQRVKPQAGAYTLSSKYAKYPLLCRPGTSDVLVFLQIFGEREYLCLDEVEDARLVIDCGANVGYSAAYFLTRFPNAKVIAIEPDPGNFALLEANVAPYLARCDTMLTAVWSHETDLVISEVPFRDGREWARTVRPVQPGEKAAKGSMRAIDIGTVLARSGYDRISVLKVDIEGAESEVFASNYESWLPKVDNLVIELHGEKESAVFQRAIAREGFKTSTHGELFVCRRA